MESDGVPVALLDSQGKKLRVVELNALARSSRVEVGMTPTQATARCADLHLLSGNLGHERSAQDALLQTAETLSPFLEATAPGVVTIELPSERPFTEAELIQKCVTPLVPLGLDIRVGVAATPGLARLSARFGNPVRMVDAPANFLAPLPVDFLQPSEEILSVLGIDAVMIGPADLSISLGVPGDFQHPKVVAAMEAVRDTCVSKGIAPGTQTRNVALARFWKERGMRFLGCGSEIGFLFEKAKETASAVLAD